MINPDGVMIGNYRTNLSGLDLNRRWDGSKCKQASEINLVKKYISVNSKNRQIAFIIDLHGHSRKYKNYNLDYIVFFTGILERVLNL